MTELLLTMLGVAAAEYDQARRAAPGRHRLVDDDDAEWGAALKAMSFRMAPVWRAYA